MEKYVPKFKIKEDAEEDKSIKAVKDLIDLDWEADDDSKHKAVAIIQGLFTADTKIGNDFLKQLSDFTSGLKIEDFKESTISKKDEKIKESVTGINNIQSASEAITLGIQFIGNKFPADRAANFSHLISGAIFRGYDALFSDNPEMNIEDKGKVIKRSLIKIVKNVMDRV